MVRNPNLNPTPNPNQCPSPNPNQAVQDFSKGLRQHDARAKTARPLAPRATAPAAAEQVEALSG